MVLAMDQTVPEVERQVEQTLLKRLFSMPVPAEWDRQNEIIVVNHVAKASKEYQSVLADFHKTLPGVQSVRLHRIQNLWLWEKYQHCQERMLLKSPESATEQQLFHGTRFTTPEDLYRSEYGFDFRLASPNARWGVGTYFTSSAAYSDRYSFKIPDTSHKQILIAKVLTGQSCPWPQQRTLTKPPPKPDVVSSKFRNECYDSVYGRISDSDIYVIYDHEKVYPAYVVTYTS